MTCSMRDPRRWLLLAVLIVGCGPRTPIVVEGQTTCWEPANTMLQDVDTYAVVTRRSDSYVLQHCLWRPYGGLYYRNMRLMAVDTVEVDSIVVWKVR